MYNTELSVRPSASHDVPALMRALLRHVAYTGALLLLLAVAGSLLAR
jgi:hypothetical protein